MTDTKGQKMIILTLENDILKLDETFAYQNEYLLRGLIINERFYTMNGMNLCIWLMLQFQHAVSVHRTLLHHYTLSYADYLKGCRYYLLAFTKITSSVVRLIIFRL